MPVSIPKLPPPPPPQVARFDAQGKPTRAQVEYETRMQVWLNALASALITVGG